MDISMIVLAHLGLLAISIIVFVVRGLLMVIGSPSMNSKLLLGLATLTMLLILASGLGLVILSGKSFTDSFVIMKMIGLVLYVVLAILALRPNMSKALGVVFWLLGAGSFAYTYLFAFGKVPSI